MKYPEETENELKRWMEFLINPESERDAIREEGLEEGRKEGMKQGIQEGILKGQKNEKEVVAKKLLKLELPIKQIVEITELSEDEIENLK